MSGSYSVTGNYLSSGQGNGIDVTETAGTDNKADSYWYHTFAMKPVMTVNDKIKMVSEIRLADSTFWGNQAGGDLNGAGSTAAGDVYVHRLYMDWMSPMGKVNIGRVSAGPWGTPFLDNDSRADAIKFWPSALASGPWSTYFYVGKVTEGDAAITVNTLNANILSKLSDSDSYEARLYYKDDALNGGIRYNMSNNNTAAASNTSNITMGLYGVYKWSNYFFATEIVHLDGDTEADTGITTAERDADAALFEIGGTFDNLSVAAAYVYLSGDNNAADTDNEAFAALNGGTGTEFTPLYILTGRGMGCLNGDITVADGVTSGAVATAGAHTLALLADYQYSDRLSLHAGLAWAQADEEYQTGAGGLGYVGRDSDYGMEYDLGAAYKLLDNLTYEAHFGYLDTGDFFNTAANANDANSVYVLTNSLTMTF